MKHILPIFCILMLFVSPVFAQEAEEQQNQPTEFYMTPNQKGDQFIQFSLGFTIPLNFPDVYSLFHNEDDEFTLTGTTAKLHMGGLGNLGYQYFLTDKIFVGGEIGFGFNPTIGSHMMNIIPVYISAGFQPVVKRFEFPLTIGIGCCTTSYLGFTYFGLIARAKAGTFFRITESWSGGLEFTYIMLPQFYEDGTNYIGHFGSVSFSARYHF